MSYNQIKKHYQNIHRMLFTIMGINGLMLSDELCDLCDAINAYDGDEEIWYIGEDEGVYLSDLIVGAYWFFTDYHQGQYSRTYEVLCKLGEVFSPGMSSLEEDTPEHDVYKAFESFLGVIPEESAGDTANECGNDSRR